MTQMHVPGVITTPITLDYRDADGDGFIDEPLFDINMDGTIDEKDVVDLDGNGKVGNTDLAYDDFKDDPEKTQWKGYNHPNCTVNVNVTKPPQYIKVINNDGVNGSGGYVYYIRNTATTGYSDGGWNREPGVQDTFGGFFGNTKFYYGTGENDYFHGSNFPSQNKTTTFKFY
jgi:hypothetical protein